MPLVLMCLGRDDLCVMNHDVHTIKDSRTALQPTKSFFLYQFLVCSCVQNFAEMTDHL